jgi:hypothetical protein
MKIEAYFSGIKNANEAVQKLKNAGFNNALADINDHYVEFNNGVQPRLPGTENAPNLSSLVLSSGEHIEDSSKKPLDAASPMVSGMGGFEEIMDVNYKVAVNIDLKDVDKAKQIISESGGDLRDPNLDLPHRLKDINLKLGDLDFK